MKKITIINKHLGIGGTEKYLSSLTKILTDDYDVNLIVSYKIKEIPTFPISTKVNVSYLVKGFPTYKEIHKYIKRKQYFNAFKEYINNIKLKFMRFIETIKVVRNINSDYLIMTRLYDIVITNLFLHNKKTKKIVVIHKNYKGLRKLLLIVNLKKIERIIVPTLEMKDEFNKKFKDKVEYISNFIETTKVKSKLNNKNIISIGNFSKDKNVLELIDIMNEINKKDKDINLILIGDGKKKNKIRDKISNLNLENNIILTGNLNKLEIEDYMLNSSVYVSSTLNDSFGLQFLEAMNYGLPVVCYKSSNKFITNDELLINNKNISEFADKIIYLFENKKELKYNSKISLNNIKDYNLKEVAFKWKNVIKNIK